MVGAVIVLLNYGGDMASTWIGSHKLHVGALEVSLKNEHYCN